MVINPSDNEALKRIINYPARGIGQTTESKLETNSVESGISMWEAIHLLPGTNPAGFNKGIISKILEFKALIDIFMNFSFEHDAYETARFIAEKTGILKELYNDKSPEGLSRHENIQELLNGIQEFSISAREEGNALKLENYLEDVALLTDQDNEKDEDRDKVTLMTVHSAKGLEFKNVFVAGLEENLFPSNQGDEFNRAEALEEERRLFYVAITRAKENAWFTYANQRYKWGKLEFCSPSRFLTEMDEKYLDHGFSSLSASVLEKTKRRESLSEGLLNSFNPSPFVNYRNDTAKTVLNRKMNELKNIELQNQAFEADDPLKIQTGMVVLHQRFGEGKVIKLEGFGQELKATVFFQNQGLKQLLMKFAKLKIVR
jgi:DNA helicase-2/ATP-dependent DNA helicase PcrA